MIPQARSMAFSARSRASSCGSKKATVRRRCLGSPSGAAEPEAGDSRRKSSPTMRGLRRTDLSRRTSRFMPAGASRPRGSPTGRSVQLSCNRARRTKGVQRGTGGSAKSPYWRGSQALSCPPVPPLYCAPEPEVAGSNPAARAPENPLGERVLVVLARDLQAARGALGEQWANTRGADAGAGGFDTHREPSPRWAPGGPLRRGGRSGARPAGKTWPRAAATRSGLSPSWMRRLA